MNPFKIHPRLKLVLTRFSSLILLFQRMPVVQMLFPEANILGGSSLANSFSLAITTVVGLGAFDSVAGQSQISERVPLVVLGTNPALNLATSGNLVNATYAINVPATVSNALDFKFNWDPNNKFSPVKSWRCTTGGFDNTLPPGLSPTSAATPTITIGGLISIGGTPTAAPGIHPVTITVFRSTNFNMSDDYASQIFNICVLGFSAQPTATTPIISGATATLTCTAAGNPVGTTRHPGNGVLTYEWYAGTSGTLGAILGTSPSFTTPHLTTPPLTTTTYNYWVRIKSVLGTSTVTANSNTAAVTVSPPPTVTVAPADTSTSGSPINFTLSFTQSVTGLATSGITVTNGTKGTLTGSGASYILPVTPTAQGAVTCQVNAGAASGNTASNIASVTYDSIAPTVTINQALAQADPTGTSPINFTVLFSESVADFATGDVTISGTSGGTKTATVTGSGTTYNVAVSGMTTAGTVIATLPATVAHDAANNASAATTSIDNSVTFTVATPFDTWASGLLAGQKGPSQTPKNDGVTNLMKFASNLNPLAPDNRSLTVGANGTAGLPGQTMAAGKLRVEFLRRKASTNPGISYSLEFTSDVSTNSWSGTDVSTTPAGTSIDGTWERVTIDDALGGTKRFARMKVIQP